MNYCSCECPSALSLSVLPLLPVEVASAWGKQSKINPDAFWSGMMWSKAPKRLRLLCLTLYYKLSGNISLSHLTALSEIHISIYVCMYACMYICILDSRSNKPLSLKIFTLEFSYFISSTEVSTLFRNQDHLHTKPPAVELGKPSLKHHVSVSTILQRTFFTSPSV